MYRLTVEAISGSWYEHVYAFFWEIPQNLKRITVANLVKG